MLGGRASVAPHFAAVLIAANDAAYARLGVKVVPDILKERCALTGVHAILSAAKTDWCFITACDMPFVNPELARHLWKQAGEFNRIAARTDHGVEPLHALYSKACIPALDAAADAGKWKLQDFWIGPESRVIPVTDTAPFRNINTPEDWREIVGP